MTTIHSCIHKLCFARLSSTSLYRSQVLTTHHSTRHHASHLPTKFQRLLVQGLVQSASMDKAVAFVDPSERPKMGSLLDEKKKMRTQVRRELKQVSPDQRAKEDTVVQQHIINSEWFKHSQRICAYISCPALREVGTESLVAETLNAGNKTLYVPRVEDNESHMRMLRITNTSQDVVPNSMNILEPTPALPDGTSRDDLMEAEEPLDLLLMPGLAFDRRGGRLGRGGGYYDVFIQGYMEKARARGWKKPLLVALTYEIQLRDELIPMDESDAAIDALVYHKGLLAFKGGQLDADGKSREAS